MKVFSTWLKRTTPIRAQTTVAAISFVCFLVAGFTRSAVICLILGVVLVIATVLVLRNTVGKKSGEVIRSNNRIAAEED